MYEPKTDEKYIKQKLMKTGARHLYNSLNVVTNMKSLSGILYVNAILIKIEQAKKLFVIDFSEGCEVYIPSDLSQNNLPISFRYYDPIIQIV